MHPRTVPDEPMALVGVGTDVVDIARIDRLMARGSRRFLTRWFRPAEVKFCLAGDPVVRTAELLAAKEATLKSLAAPDDGPVPWRQIEITHDPWPGVRLHGVMRAVASSTGATAFRVAVGHTTGYAMASVVACSAAVIPQPDAE